MAGYPFEGLRRHYNYVVVDTQNNEIPTLGAGNFILARPGYAPEPIYIGEADSVYQILTITNLLELASVKYGATVLYVHLNPEQRERTAEWGDLVAKWNPPMNAELAEK
jgi:hypothetical protein